MVYTNTGAVAVSLNGMNIVYFVNLFTMVNMLSNWTSHAGSLDFGNLVIKSMVTDSQGAPGASSCVTPS